MILTFGIDKIRLMVADGTEGTNDGDGLAQVIHSFFDDLVKLALGFANLSKVINQASARFGVTGSRAFYIAARLYNSGSVDPSNILERGIATHCYSSDIANRLTGWVLANHACSFDG